MSPVGETRRDPCATIRDAIKVHEEELDVELGPILTLEDEGDRVRVWFASGEFLASMSSVHADARLTLEAS